MKIVIIGAGVAGLASLKYGIDYGHECVVYEQAEQLGGLWVYREEVVDKEGFPISSPMHRDLMTNGPTDIMKLANFPYPETPSSFVHHSEVLKYLKNFADHFKLHKYIQYFKRITQVKPLANKKWSISVQDLKTNETISNVCDAVFVCVGRHSVPKYPIIPGQDLFNGTQIHSLYFRTPDCYKNKRVLIIGWGPSAMDISRLVAQVTSNVYVSYKQPLGPVAPKQVILKPLVSHFEADKVVFKDGSDVEIDTVIYATGYQMTFPFLTKECGIQVQDYWVKSLYKDIINIKHPTMYFIGISIDTAVIPLMDLQVRFAFAHLDQRFTTPTKEAMIKEQNDYICKRKNQIIPTHNTHNLFNATRQQEEYFEILSTIAKIEPVPPVIPDIYRQLRTFETYPKFLEIVDDHTFIAYD